MTCWIGGCNRRANHPGRCTSHVDENGDPVPTGDFCPNCNSTDRAARNQVSLHTGKLAICEDRWHTN